MLQIIITYLVKVTLCSSLLFIYYHVALRNKRFHYYNRFYLLMSVILSLVLPLFKFSLFTMESNNDNAIRILNLIYADGETDAIFRTPGPTFGWEQYFLFVLIAFSLVLLMIRFLRVWKIYRIKRRYPVEKTSQFDFINTDIQQAPFSFLR